MYIETYYRQPIDLQSSDSERNDAIEARDRRENGNEMDLVRWIAVYDRAGRIPYEDVC